MLTEICQYLNNYFEYEKHIGLISIIGGVVFCDGKEVLIGQGQYFALFRDKFVLGVFKQGDTLTDKTFDGAIWLMDVPVGVVNADKWADDWMKKNGGVDSDANSPFQSESFDVYSYSKSSGKDGRIGGSVFDQAGFLGMIAPYRKLK